MLNLEISCVPFSSCLYSPTESISPAIYCRLGTLPRQIQWFIPQICNDAGGLEFPLTKSVNDDGCLL